MPLFGDQQTRRRCDEAAGRLPRSDRRVKGTRSESTAPQIRTEGKGYRDAVLFLSATSLDNVRVPVPGVCALSLVATLGWVPGEARRALRWVVVPAGAKR